MGLIFFIIIKILYYYIIRFFFLINNLIKIVISKYRGRDIFILPIFNTRFLSNAIMLINWKLKKLEKNLKITICIRIKKIQKYTVKCE